ncbi:MAG: hypothetical protein GDA48_14645 [Hormoscilla sp. GM102CHS1]|nr:hypothetical protein [Hormoscilla sp. GM102CHS1]
MKNCSAFHNSEENRVRSQAEPWERGLTVKLPEYFVIVATFNRKCDTFTSWRVVELLAKMRSYQRKLFAG